MFERDPRPLSTLAARARRSAVRRLRRADPDAAAWDRDRICPAPAPEPVDDPGLLSFITPVWNTPLPYLRELADGLLAQGRNQPFEWVVLDNGSTDPDLTAYLDGHLSRREQVRFVRSATNLGIVGGSRLCLERATGRYALMVDHDDLLYPDAAATMARAIVTAGYPPALYSDEDKLLDGRRCLPFLKPDWDPVLFLNQAYTAHLCAVDRERALAVGAFDDPECEGSPDWDCLMRFVIAGHVPLHVPRVLYSWRMHGGSTALHVGAKDYIHRSQRAVLERYARAMPGAGRFGVEQSPLTSGAPDWWLRREHAEPRPLALVVLDEPGPHVFSPGVAGDYPILAAVRIAADAHPSGLKPLLPGDWDDDALVALVASDVTIGSPDWAWEALGVVETHPDTAVVGGRIDGPRRIIDAGQHFGVGRGCDTPDAGRRTTEPGYSAWLWKRRSVSAVSARLSVFRLPFLRDLLDEPLPGSATCRFLGAWAGARAAREGDRVVYSPYLTAAARRWRPVSARERLDFLARNRDLVPDTRYYPDCFGLDFASPYRPVTQSERRSHLERLYAGVPEDGADDPPDASERGDVGPHAERAP